MGSVTQIRVLGGTIGLAICSALLSNHVTNQTTGLLTAEQQSALLQSFQSIKVLPLEMQTMIRRVYADGYSQQMRVMLYFSIASLVSLILLVERHPRNAQLNEDGEIAMPGDQAMAEDTAKRQ